MDKKLKDLRIICNNCNNEIFRAIVHEESQQINLGNGIYIGFDSSAGMTISFDAKLKCNKCGTEINNTNQIIKGEVQ